MKAELQCLTNDHEFTNEGIFSPKEASVAFEYLTNIIHEAFDRTEEFNNSLIMTFIWIFKFVDSLCSSRRHSKQNFEVL